jgi:ABC-type polysaccharide/polyol phosphate export permease
MQLLYFGTPIMYPLSMLPDQYRFVLKLNPLYSQINLFHRLIYEGWLPTAEEWGSAYLIAILTLALGSFMLIKCEDELVFRL